MITDINPLKFENMFSQSHGDMETNLVNSHQPENLNHDQPESLNQSES